ncbi:MAG: hypothetical protein IJH63_00925 [Methanobrevibacter sp.]|nr:hypothetical protein [Methanosphaera sp.]MBR0369268.1 hypothetical protein [Methanobrevibacter sp.]
MFEIIINILIIIGAIVSVIGSCFFCMFGFMILYELIEPEYNNFKLRLKNNEYKIEKEAIAIKRLELLKKDYPELEIEYNMDKKN